ncbi:MAG: endonuclease III [Candidatus Micrarchaeota archaeon]|nr:endonuclease III [Candidatus Micrarchaeota archaeon]
MQDARYAQLVLRRLSKRYGYNIHTQLAHRNMTHLFVAVLLSPQSTDVQTNRTTEKLFRRFRTFRDYADADPKTLRRYLKGMNYYKTKAKHLRESSKMMIERFHGTVPRTLAEMMELPGVGRKVANVVLNEGYGIDEGIAIDTHAGRVARRMGFARSKDPHKIEMALLKTYPQKDWGRVSNTFIELGRDTCKARKKECYRCVLKDICPSSDVRQNTN